MSTETVDRGERTTCEGCGLPYYADENDACPYCDSRAAAEQTTDEHPQSRSRLTCDDCGLPYYADDGDDCPYCEHASREPRARETDATASATEPEATSHERREATTANARSSEREPSLLKRISNKVREVFGGV